MAERSSLRPQVIDDSFVDEMVRDLSVVGSMGVLNVGDGILPVYLLGQRESFRLEVTEPTFRASDVFSQGKKTSTTAAQTLAFSGDQPAGTYDIRLWCDGDFPQAAAIEMEVRDVANATKFKHEFFINTESGHLDVPLSLELDEGDDILILSTFVLLNPIFIQATLLLRRRGS